MRLLYWPQCSMRSYVDNRWLLSTDAQITKMAAYVANLPEDWQWFWCLPHPEHADMEGARFLELENVHTRGFTWMDNVLEGRFYFPLDEVADALDAVRPDVVLCEVPEHVRAFRCAMRRAKYSCPIIAMVEHVDFYEETKVDVPFMLRQVDGALTCDSLAFPLEGMRDEWWKATNAIMKTERMDVTRAASRTVVWPGLTDSVEVDAARDDGLALREILRDIHGEFPILFFAGRLSDGQRTKFEEVLAASNVMYNSGFAHVLIVANPNEAKPWDWVRDQSAAYRPGPWGEVQPPRSDYLAMLWAADMVPVMYPLEKIYSVGAIEAAMAETLIVTDGPGPEWTLPAVTDPLQLATFMRTYLQSDAAAELKRDAREEVLEQHGVAENITVVRETIEEVVAGARVA